MNILITGGAGMLGRKLAERLLATASLHGQPIRSITLVDVVPPGTSASHGVAVHARVADLASPEAARALVAARPDLIFHLAAIVSGQAEAEFDQGYRINLDGTRQLLEEIRLAHQADGYRPRVVLASSLAVFGGDLPAVIGDDFQQTPQTSYGTQKTICELLLADYSRKGYLDGYGLRLPTICIRPGKPNQAASGFFSSILREPLQGQRAVLPVPESMRHWFASPRAAVEFFIHAAGLDGADVGPRRNLNMPGLSATVGEALAALARAAGPQALQLIDRVPNAQVQNIIASWPQGFDARRALALGFRAESSFDEIIRVFQEDELATARP